MNDTTLLAYRLKKRNKKEENIIKHTNYFNTHLTTKIEEES